MQDKVRYLHHLAICSQPLQVRPCIHRNMPCHASSICRGRKFHRAYLVASMLAALAFVRRADTAGCRTSQNTEATRLHYAECANYYSPSISRFTRRAIGLPRHYCTM